MESTTTLPTDPRRVARTVRHRIESGGERLWRFEDFGDLPFSAVAQALSRLSKAGTLERLSKGTYYMPRSTTFGPSRPNPAAVQRLASRHKRLFPSGLAAANRLGFTTQTGGRNEFATSATSLPRKLVGEDAVVRTRRPEQWSSLSEDDAALLDVLRHRGRTGELSPQETVRRALELLAEPGRYNRLLHVANTEPPRVRAMLGALGERIGKEPAKLLPLRASLHPLSRFDFGKFASLPTARSWQAKERRPRAAV